MHTVRSKRALIGAACLVVVALAMGWFVGQYVPGTPREPEPQPLDGLTKGSGQVANKVLDSPAGSTMELRGIVQGYVNEQESDLLPAAVIEQYQGTEIWEHQCPNLDVTVDSIRAIPTASFVAWYPLYASQWDTSYNDSMMVAVDVTVKNASTETIDDWRWLPTFTLWGPSLVGIDDVMGAGAIMDRSFFFLNDNLGNPGDSGEQVAELDDTSLGLAPGKERTLVLPFKVNANNLSDRAILDNFDPSNFCIQTTDYATATTYRLWL